MATVTVPLRRAIKLREELTAKLKSEKVPYPTVVKVHINSTLRAANESALKKHLENLKSAVWEAYSKYHSLKKDDAALKEALHQANRDLGASAIISRIELLRSEIADLKLAISYMGTYTTPVSVDTAVVTVSHLKEEMKGIQTIPEENLFLSCSDASEMEAILLNRTAEMSKLRAQLEEINARNSISIELSQHTVNALGIHGEVTAPS